MKNIISILAIAAFTISCQPDGRVFVEHQELSPDLEWLKKDVREFKVPVEDNGIAYDMSLSFRFASGYQYPTANVKVTETSPSGVKRISEYKLKVREENGDYIGEPGFDIWDSEHLIAPNKKFLEVGDYTYLIEQNTPVDPLNYAMEIGIILDKAKK
jgi:gliding motility-associated lipoprotein GldH